MQLRTNVVEEPWYVEQGLIVGRDGRVTAVVRLPTWTTELDPPEHVDALVQRHADLLTAPGPGEYQLLVIPRLYRPEVWGERLKSWAHDAGNQPSPEWEAYVEGQVRYLASARHRRREVYLLRLLERPRVSPLMVAERQLGLEDPAPAAHDLERWREGRDKFRSDLAAREAGVRLATASEVRWLRWRVQHRLHDDSVLAPIEDEPCSGDDCLALAEGAVEKTGWQQLRLGAERETWFTTLALRRSKPRLDGVRWLGSILDGRPGAIEDRTSTEASVHYRLIDPEAARKVIERPLVKIRDIADHMSEVRLEPPQELREKYQAGETLQREVTEQERPLIQMWVRIGVAAPSRRELAERVNALRKRFDATHMGSIKLEQPHGDQWALFRSMVPGSGIGPHLWCQTVSPMTLAGSLFWASSELGDNQGPYLGFTLGGDEGQVDSRGIKGYRAAGHSPIATNLFRACEVHEPTGVVAKGPPGSGKTLFLLKLATEYGLSGATVVYVDPSPKEDAEGLLEIGGFPRRRHLRLDGKMREHTGLLDPFIMLRPQDDADWGDALQLASSLTLQCLPYDLSAEARMVVLGAARRVIEQRRQRSPSMPALIDAIEGMEHPQARVYADALRGLAMMPLARLFLGEAPSQEPLQLHGAVTLIQFSGIDLPAESQDPRFFTLDQQLGVALMSATAGIIGRVVKSGHPQHRRLLVVDEFSYAAKNPATRSLVVNWMRVGRAKSTVVALGSQTAAEFLHDDLLEQTGQVFAFRCRDEDDIKKTCRMLGKPVTAEIVNRFRQAAPGECIYRNLARQTGRMYVDLVWPSLLQLWDTSPSGKARRAALREKDLALAETRASGGGML